MKMEDVPADKISFQYGMLFVQRLKLVGRSCLDFFAALGNNVQSMTKISILFVSYL